MTLSPSLRLLGFARALLSANFFILLFPSASGRPIDAGSLLWLGASGSFVWIGWLKSTVARGLPVVQCGVSQ